MHLNETCSFTLLEKHRIRVFEKVVLRRIFCLDCRSNKEPENVRYEKLHDLYPSFVK